MPRKSVAQRSPRRRRASAATLFCALTLMALAWGTFSALAQGGGRAQRQQQQQPSQGGPKLKLTPLRSSESQKGSRVTITGTDSLGDYQSYRSGERFYVRIPNADAAAVRGGVRGRGFEDAQVQKSGGDVILSFRVKPGARPSVKQRFNQLDVEFASPEGSGDSSAQTPQARPEEGRAPVTETPRDAGSQTRTTQTTSTDETSEAARRAAEQRAQDQNATRQAGESLPPVADLPNQLPQTQQQTTQTEPSAAAPAVTPAEIAQAGQPAQNPSGPATTTSAPVSNQPSASFGAAVARNWMPLAAVAAILAVGLGLFFVARRSSTQTTPPPPAVTAEVAEAKTARLKEPSAPALDEGAATIPAATAATTAAAFVPSVTEKVRKKGKKARLKAERAAREAAARAEAPAVAKDEASAAAEVTAVAESSSSSAAAEEVEAAKVDESVAEEASAVAPVVAAGAVAADESPAVVEEESSKAIEPVAVVYDAETVQSETRSLLEGESYDAAVLATGDRSTRQMIAAELLAALAARNPARKERARTAFIEHGYFNEAARDLREAEAPAERASAARSLGLVGDCIATPHLAAALEDSSVEVRKAAVEALASVRDPEAVGALEELISREKSLKTKVPRKFVQRAIEACAEAPALAPPSLAATTAATVLAGDATRAEEEAPAAPDAAAETPVTAIAPIAAAEDEATPTAVEERAITLAEEPTPTLAEESTPTLIEEATPTIVERADATLAERPDRTLAEAPAQTLAESATPTLVESATPTLFEDATPTRVEEVSTPTTLDAPAPAAAVEPAPVEEETAVAEAPTIEEASAPEAVEVAAEAERVETVEVAEPEAAAAEPVAEAAPVTEIEPVSESELVDEAEPVSETESVSEIEPFSFVASSESFAPAESYEPAEAFEPAARDAEAPQAEPAPARFEDFESLAGAPQPDEWVELDFGVTESTPAQFSAESAASQPTSFQTYTEELYAPPAAEEARDEFAPATAETEAPDASPAPPMTEFVSTAVESTNPSAAVEPYGESSPADEGTLVTPGRAEDTGARAQEKGVAEYTEDDYSTVPKFIRDRLTSIEPVERAEAVKELARVESGEAFEVICSGFDDPSPEVRSAAARSLYDMQDDRADAFTRALRESTPQRRRNIGAAIASSGLASEAISNLTGESREKTYDAFSLLFLMAKAGEVQPLVRAVEGHPDGEVRLAVVKLLALSGQKDVLPAFRRLAVRGTLPAEVRAAVMEAIYQISSQETQKA